MISQPMGGKTEKEIEEQRGKAIRLLAEAGFEIADTYFKEEFKEARDKVKNVPLFLLAKSLEKMSDCDAVYFCKGWDKTSGCRLEHKAAIEYGLDIIFEV